MSGYKKNRSHILAAVLCMILSICMLIGCGKKEETNTDQITEVEQNTQKEQVSTESDTEESEPEQETIVEETPEAIPEPEETHEGEVQSPLTGMWIPEEYANTRPYSIMLNNIETAYPQSGINGAGILYEALAEGGITRFMGVFEYVDSERIGSVRSARHYFVTTAKEYDSIFVHFGGAKYAYTKMEELDIAHLDGLKGEGNYMFYRDESIPAPDNAFTFTDGIMEATKNKGYRTERKEGYAEHFKLSLEEKVVLNGSDSKDVTTLTLPYSAYGTCKLVYNADHDTYQRYGYDELHIDANTKEPVEFTTVLVQLVNEYSIDKKGYQSMDLEYSNGKGYYMTGGKLVPIWWAKEGSASRTIYYYDSARTQEIVLNPGRIYIGLYPDNRTGNITME